MDQNYTGLGAFQTAVAKFSIVTPCAVIWLSKFAKKLKCQKILTHNLYKVEANLWLRRLATAEFPMTGPSERAKHARLPRTLGPPNYSHRPCLTSVGSVGSAGRSTVAGTIHGYSFF